MVTLNWPPLAPSARARESPLRRVRNRFGGSGSATRGTLNGRELVDCWCPTAFVLPPLPSLPSPCLARKPRSRASDSPAAPFWAVVPKGPGENSKLMHHGEVSAVTSPRNHNLRGACLFSSESNPLYQGGPLYINSKGELRALLSHFVTPPQFRFKLLNSTKYSSRQRLRPAKEFGPAAYAFQRRGIS